MNPEEIAAIVNLATALAPPVLTFVNNLMAAFNSSNMTQDQRMQAILDLQSKLSPMKPVAEPESAA